MPRTIQAVSTALSKSYPEGTTQLLFDHTTDDPPMAQHRPKQHVTSSPNRCLQYVAVRVTTGEPHTRDAPSGRGNGIFAPGKHSVRNIVAKPDYLQRRSKADSLR